jgi:hypothetical protein
MKTGHFNLLRTEQSAMSTTSATIAKIVTTQKYGAKPPHQNAEARSKTTIVVVRLLSGEPLCP